MFKSFKSIFRLDQLMVKEVKGSFIDLPSPKNNSYFFNFGFSLTMFLFIQIISGVLLALCYIGDVSTAFSCVDLIVRDVNYGWVVRNFHSKGASFFFLSMYIHMARGLYFFSFYYIKVWFTGMLIFVLSMAVGFFGYVLPWGQMSYWAATVMTNLFSIIPVMGVDVVQWLWGGFAVSLPTLTRFFSFHFLFPFMLLGVFILHVVFLHERGSNNPLGVRSDSDKVTFFPYYSDKDIYSQLLMMIFYMFMVFYYPYSMINTSNFLESKPLVTPEHMEPEWYLLAPYTILRSMPSKVGGVLMLIMFFIVLMGLPFYVQYKVRGFQYKLILQFMFFLWSMNYMFLTWGGSVPPEFPYLFLSQVSCFGFFIYFVMLGLMKLSEI